MTRAEQAEIYEQKYADIPRDYNERLAWMIDKYNLSARQMDEIVNKKNAMMQNLFFYDYQVIIYEIPRIKPRPRYRVINRKNFMDAAISNPNFIQVYSPYAKDDHERMHRLVQEELEQLHLFIQTPCMITLNAYEQTPTSFNITDTFLAEYGLILNISHNDYDNILKATSDNLNENVWLDDSLVVSGTVNKLYSILPREEIFIKYLNCAVNKSQYNRITSRKEYKEDYPITYLDKKGYLV